MSTERIESLLEELVTEARKIRQSLSLAEKAKVEAEKSRVEAEAKRMRLVPIQWQGESVPLGLVASVLVVKDTIEVRPPVDASTDVMIQVMTRLRANGFEFGGISPPDAAGQQALIYDAREPR